MSSYYIDYKSPHDLQIAYKNIVYTTKPIKCNKNNVTMNKKKQKISSDFAIHVYSKFLHK